MSSREYETDVRWMERYLRAHGPTTNTELIEVSKRIRGCRFTPHSRAAEIRARIRLAGEDLKVKPIGTGRRRDYLYEIVTVGAPKAVAA